MAKKPEIKLDEHGLPETIDVYALSFLTGLKERRLNQLVTDMRIPADVRVPDSGRWYAAKALVEIFGYYRRQLDKKRPTNARDLEEQNALEDLKTKKIKNAKSQRDWLPRFAVRDSWGEYLTIFKNRFMNFSHKMGPRAFGAADKVEAAEILEREVQDIFAGLMDPKIIDEIDSRIPDEEVTSDGKPDHASASPDRRPDLEPTHA